MIMADVFKILFLILGFLTTVVCYWLLFQAVMGAAVERARATYEARPRKTLLVGAAITLPVMVVGLALANAPGGLAKFLGVAALLLLALLGLMGSTGLAQRVGYGLASAEDDRWPWRRVLRGGVVLAITFVMPLVGWFVVLPYVLISGVGAAVLAYRSRPRTRPQPATVETLTPAMGAQL